MFPWQGTLQAGGEAQVDPLCSINPFPRYPSTYFLAELESYAAAEADTYILEVQPTQWTSKHHLDGYSMYLGENRYPRQMEPPHGGDTTGSPPGGL